MSSTMTATDSATDSVRAKPISGIPMTRIIGVEIRKMFDTRSGFWLVASIAITAVLASAAVIIFGRKDAITYNTFGAAIGIPIAVILPVIAILSVTSEWSQRSGLTTFTLVPHRTRIVWAKLVAAVVVAVASMIAAFGIAALGNVVGAAIKGADLTWNVSVGQLATTVLGNVLGLLVGFMLGVLIRNSAGALVGYFVFTFVLPTIAGILSSTTSWFGNTAPWVEFNTAQQALFGPGMAGKDWAHIGSVSAIWILVPTVVGIWFVLRSEVK